MIIWHLSIADPANTYDRVSVHATLDEALEAAQSSAGRVLTWTVANSGRRDAQLAGIGYRVMSMSIPDGPGR